MQRFPAMSFIGVDDIDGFVPYCSIPPDLLATIQKGIKRQRYREVRFLKSPLDVSIYLKLLERERFETIIEIGSLEGGSALWFADQMKQLDLRPKVVMVDLQPSLITGDYFLQVIADANSLDQSDLSKLLDECPHPWLVVEDSSHYASTSLAVLNYFDSKLHPNDWIVIEDGIISFMEGKLEADRDGGPRLAIVEFLRRCGDRYLIDRELCDMYGENATWSPNGFLRRVG